MALGTLVSTSHSAAVGEVRFEVRSHPDQGRPFVVLVLGHRDVTVHLFDVATVDALQAAVAEARDLLTAALVGQDRLPVELTAASA
jgi:hypothetical protein